MKSPSKGFTLPELLIVVLVIAILATLAYPSYDRFMRNARIEKTKADMLATALQIDRYYARYRHFPDANTFNEAKNGSGSLNLNNLLNNSYFDIRLTNQDSDINNVDKPENYQYFLIAVPNLEHNNNENRILKLDSDGLFYVCQLNGNIHNCELR